MKLQWQEIFKKVTIQELAKITPVICVAVIGALLIEETVWSGMFWYWTLIITAGLLLFLKAKSEFTRPSLAKKSDTGTIAAQRDQLLIDLAAQGVITIYGTINEMMVAKVRDMLAVARANNVEELEVQIQSRGGNVAAGLEIYDLLRVAPVKKRTGIVFGYAHSMGAVILQACEVREAPRHARILIHHISISERTSLHVLRDPEKLRKKIAESEVTQNHINQILSKRTKRSVEEIEVELEKDAEMTTSEAIAFGLIDTIRD